MLQHVSELPSLKRLNITPFYVYVILFICSSFGGHSACFYHLSVVNNVAINMVYKYVFKSLFSLTLGIYPEVELLDRMVISCLIFWGIAVLFSTASAPFYIPSSNARRFWFLHILTNTFFKNNSHPNGHDVCFAFNYKFNLFSTFGAI